MGDNDPSHTTVCGRCGSECFPTHALGCRTCLERDLLSTAADFFLPDAAADRELPGTGFTLLEEIGRGGMGVVYRARQGQSEREVAVKLLQPHLVSDPAIARRLLVEAEALAEMDHPGILPLYASGEFGGQPWLAMKLASGGNLAMQREAWTGRWRETAALIAGLAEAVQHAHDRGLIHRDIKPANVLFDDTGRACLADFGLAKWQEAVGGQTQSLAVLGTPAYLAPEVARLGGKAATTASDVYGLGAILYELLTGRPVYTGNSSAEILHRIGISPPAPPRRVRPDVPADMEVICLKALAREPKDRYTTAAAFAEDLRCWQEGRAIAARPSTTFETLSRWTRHNPLAASLAGILILALIGGSVAVGAKNRSLHAANTALQTSIQAATKARAAAEDRVNYNVRELPALLDPIGRLGVLDGMFQNVAAYYNGIGSTDDAAALARQADFHIQWAAVLAPQGRAAEAREQLEMARTLAERATALPDAGADAWRARVAALREFGEFSVEQDELAAGVDLTHTATIIALEGWRRFPGSALLAEKAEALTEHGAALAEANRHAEAREMLTAALADWETVVAAGDFTDTSRLAQRQSITLHELGTVLRPLRAPSNEILAPFRAALAIQRQQCAGVTQPSEPQLNLAIALNRVADQLLQPVNQTVSDESIAEADTLLHEAESLIAGLVAHDSLNRRWKAEWGLSALALAHLDYCRQDPAGSRRWLQTALSRLEALPAGAHFGIRTSTVWALHYLAQNFADSDDTDEALAHWDRALEAGFALLRADPRRWQNFGDWEDVLRAATQYRAATRGAPETQKVLQDWMGRIDAEVAKEDSSAWWRRSAAGVHRRLADLFPAASEQAALENLKAFSLRASVLTAERRVGPQIVGDLASAADKVLSNQSSPPDARIQVAEDLTHGASRIAELSPTGRWRHVWASHILKGAAGLASPARRKLLEAAQAVLFPDPPPRKWTQEETEASTLLQRAVAEAVLDLPPPSSAHDSSTPPPANP